VLTNPFPHGKNTTQASSSVDGGSQGPPVSSCNHSVANVYMMKGDTYIATREHDYGMSKSVEKGKEAINRCVPLQFERTMGETMTHILKGAFKKASLNPKVRAAQNYSMFKDFHKPLAQCLLWRSSSSLHRERLCDLPWDLQRLVI
jgi:hypothetical protein